MARLRWAVLLALVLYLSLATPSGPAGLAGLPASRDAQWDPLCGDNLRIELIPAQPHADEPIRIICRGDWRDSCVPSYLTSTIGPGKVQLWAVLDYPAPVGCADVITPWSLETVIGPLPSGRYVLELYMRDLRNPSVVTLCATRPFLVLGGSCSVFLPLLGRWPD